MEARNLLLLRNKAEHERDVRVLFLFLFLSVRKAVGLRVALPINSSSSS